MASIKHKPYIEVAEELIEHARTRYLSVDENSLTGDLLESVLEAYKEVMIETFQCLSYPLFPTDIEPSEQGRIKLYIMSKILGTESFAFPSGAESKYLGILDVNRPPPGNISHGIPEADPGGQVLPTAGSPITQNIVTTSKPEFKTLLIGKGLLKGGLITYDGLLKHAASFLECDVSDVSITIKTPRVVTINTTVEVLSSRATVYNTFFAGLISHIGILIHLEPNEIS